MYVYRQNYHSTMHREVDNKTLDVIKSMSQCIQEFKDNDTYSYYYNELEYIAISTMCFQVMTLVNKRDTRSLLQNVIMEQLLKMFPSCLNNRYLQNGEKKRLRYALEHKYMGYYFHYSLPSIIKTQLKNSLMKNLYLKLSKEKNKVTGC